MNDESSPLFSSYGIMTAERILEKYSIHITQPEFLVVLKNTNTLYHCMLQVPYKNILDSIVLQQAQDYFVFTQKLFIDYLLADQSEKPEDIYGHSTREDIEEERKQLVEYTQRFNELKLELDRLIAQSQAFLINFSQEIKTRIRTIVKEFTVIFKEQGIPASKINKALNHALIYANFMDNSSLGNEFSEALESAISNNAIQDITQNLASFLQTLPDNLSEFSQRSKRIGEEIVYFRTTFYDQILRIKSLMNILSDYPMDKNREFKNQESLIFDDSIGE